MKTWPYAIAGVVNLFVFIGFGYHVIDAWAAGVVPVVEMLLMVLQMVNVRACWNCGEE